MKIGLEEAIPWLETIHEKSEVERVDQRTAAYRLAAELRFYRQFAGIQKAPGFTCSPPPGAPCQQGAPNCLIQSSNPNGAGQGKGNADSQINHYRIVS